MWFYVEGKEGTPITNRLYLNNNYCYNIETETKCATSEYCEYYNNPDWCIGNLPLKVEPNTFSVFSVFQPKIGSNYPAPDGR